MNTASAICPGVCIVGGSFGNDAPANLVAYARENLDSAAAETIAAFAERFRRSVAENQVLDFHYNTVLMDVPAEHRENMEALFRDLEVYWLDNRYAMLRKVAQEDLPHDEVVKLLEKYCLGEPWRADPEIPKIAARIVVRRLTQWDLVCILHDKVRDMLGEQGDGDDAWKERRGPMSRLIAFLHWVPYNWVEELLLLFLEHVRLCDAVDNTRFHVSVLRAFFTRPRIQAAIIRKLCGLLFRRFDGKIPPTLLGLMRAVLVAGGEGTWDYLERRLVEDADLYLSEFCLEVMASIDKVRTARLLHEMRRSVCERLGVQAYIGLMAETGERSRNMSGEIVDFWDDNQPILKLAILEAVDELHCTQACSFLVKQVAKEKNVGFQLRMLDTIASAGEFDGVMDLVSRVGRGHPVLYYHIIDLCHRRLLADPVMLTRLKDLAPLLHLEIARAQIYDLYLFIFNFRELVHGLACIVKSLDDGAGEGAVRISESFEVTGDGGGEIAGLVAEVNKRARAHQQKKIGCEAAEILRYASEFSPRYADDIFGRTTARFPASKMLTEDDLNRFISPDQPQGLLVALTGLSQKAERSVRFMQDYFLFKEWFVRTAPFVLHDGMGALVDAIRRGEKVAFDPDKLLDKSYAAEIREAFRIFYECTKQGAYLTDVLYDYLREYPPEEVPHRVEEDLTHHRSYVARGRLTFMPDSDFDRHLEFTTFAHAYRYGKESMSQPSILYLWLRYQDACTKLAEEHARGGWPRLPRHPEMHAVMGPLVERMYRQQHDDATVFYEFLLRVYERFVSRGIRVRVIPNITYGLFCIAPIIDDIVAKGVHVSLAGISSRYCDDMNITEYSLGRDAAHPVKPYLFSTASNYGTLNHDRVLVVVDGTMEPLDRHDPTKIRLPKAHRGYLNHIVAVNFVRSTYGYGMQDPIREVASALQLSERYVRNLAHTVKFKQVVNRLLLSFDRDELAHFQQRAGTGRTYYSFAQWNPDAMSAYSGSRGYEPSVIPCARVDELACPSLIFVSMNAFLGKGKIPAFFDNNPEVEKSRIVLGPDGAKLDTGWPHEDQGVVIEFPEGENR